MTRPELVMATTLGAARDAIANRSTTAGELLRTCLARADDPRGEGVRVFPYGTSRAAELQAQASDMLRECGVYGALGGLPISIKDLFDVQGEVTRAGSRVIQDDAASTDAVAIGRLRAVGAVFVGRTNMTEFAYSGVGINPHYGTPSNPYERTNAARIPGGSSSGAAVSVTDGMALAAIGSDTGGSCRIPAALCGIVGFKPTAKRIPLAGSVALSPSYDSIGSLANSVDCCALLDAVMAGDAPAVPGPRSLSGLRVAVPRNIVFEGISDAVAAAFSRALGTMSSAGAVVSDVEFPSWERLGELGQQGGLVAAEASAWHRTLMARHASEYDPRVLSRIRLAEPQGAVDYLRMRAVRDELCRLADRELAPFDVIALPTVPMVAPRISELETDDAFFSANRLLLRNPAIANMLDLCALSVPCHSPGDAPVGLMLFGRNMADRSLLGIGAAVEQLLGKAHR